MRPTVRLRPHTGSLGRAQEERDLQLLPRNGALTNLADPSSFHISGDFLTREEEQFKSVTPHGLDHSRGDKAQSLVPRKAELDRELGTLCRTPSP